MKTKIVKFRLRFVSLFFVYRLKIKLVGFASKYGVENLEHHIYLWIGIIGRIGRVC